MGVRPRCTPADPGRARLGRLLVLTVPALVTVTAAVLLLVRRRTAVVPAALAFAMTLVAFLEGNAVLAVELHRTVRR